jgi:hypothetical protein
MPHAAAYQVALAILAALPGALFLSVGLGLEDEIANDATAFPINIVLMAFLLIALILYLKRWPVLQWLALLLFGFGAWQTIVILFLIVGVPYASWMVFLSAAIAMTITYKAMC